MIRPLPSLRENHAKRRTKSCTLFLIDLDDFHSKIEGPRDSEKKQALLRLVFNWMAYHVPGRPSLYRHGRDSLLAVYWEQPINTVLSELFVLPLEFSRTPFATGRGQELKFSFTGAVAEFPSHGDTLDDVVRIAEDTVFEGKEAGKNRVLVATPRRMVTRTSHYTRLQLQRLARLADSLGVTDAQLLREALDDLIRKHDAGPV